MTESAKLPVAALDPRGITIDEYMKFTPEKLELISGYLIRGPEMPEPRRDLLALLLMNTGLIETVKLAPRAQWVEALNRAYGSVS